jgi:hypothetical protein
MNKLSTFSILALPLIAGCATQSPAPPVQPVQVADRPAAAPVDVGVDWGWRLVGDAAARPVQVFSMNGQTYLQMRDRRPVVLLVGGEIIPFMTSWPYLVIQGEPGQVDIVLEGYRAIAERVSSGGGAQSSSSPAEVATGGVNSSVERASLPVPADAQGSQPVAGARRVERVKLQ